MRRHLTAALTGLLGLLVGASASPAEPVPIRVGWVVVPADLAPLMVEKPDVAKHMGKTYTPELIHFAGTPAMITGLATGDLDVVALAFSSFALAVENAHLRDLRIIADQFQDGADGYHTNPFLVRNDSPLQAVADLKGKVLASNEVGSAVDIALRAMLRKNRLSDRSDVNIIEVRFPDMKAMLGESKVVLIPGVAPFGFDPELRKNTRTLFTQKDAVGRTQMILRAARGGFIEKNRPALVDYLEDYLRVLHWYTDPANHKEAVEIIARVTKQPASHYDSWVFTKDDYYRNPEGLPDLAALQANIDLQKELGFLKTGIEVKQYADLSLVQEAATRIETGSSEAGAK